ncbi:MAG: imidazole glycerol phosphate synthase subunit HisH [Nitrosomonadaceae bacterium]|nr:imidazole glycerol phosphate synthase subunit HisH [Nitrosomonadaceae bacterium]
MITIVNYGLGNIQAIANIYNRLGVAVRVASTDKELADAQRIILPGVGSFDWAMLLLNQSGMRERLDELVALKGCPVLGICVGMQMMAKCSDEGEAAGLGWIDAEVKKFDETSFTQKTHLPHMGWNDVVPQQSGGLFAGLETDARFYFLHSYYFSPHNSDEVLTITDYNGRYASGVRRGNVYGVQFHPEKSHQWGIQLLKNFSEL